MTVLDLAGGWMQFRTVFADAPVRRPVEVWKIRRDGQDYPILGVVDYNTVSGLVISQQALELVFKKDGREVRRCRVDYAADRTTSEFRCSGTNVRGQKTATVAVWQRETDSMQPWQ